ncbi:M20 metallopeptidase family protein [Nonlabens marinus]|uniref:N-acetyl-L,L-diaminopimelate deacetylase n=1 Tax=Nonlabens marinus S1-08 TaxID=1454201 RepID=W8VP74_9FLAO|nr:amidohydrolase [Nonlabens marinus]BAO54874.1 N-acetyl-L,L-diaminopimelate deacetylase [Nonlabens marinus S1-08]
MKGTVLFLCVILAAATSCKTNKEFNHLKMAQMSDDLFPELVEIRRGLHQHPELSGQEVRTSQIVATYLRELGMEVHTNKGGHGVVGILNTGKPGKKIAWRADMDAIKSEDAEDHSFQSLNPGVSHNCGHDVHTTIGLGIANVMSQMKEQIDGQVYFIFQPSEEAFTGAQAMMQDGLLDVIQPDEIYALHVFPSQVGTVQTKSNELFAYQQTIVLNFKSSTNDSVETYINSVLESLNRQFNSGTPSSLNELTDEKLGLVNQETIYRDYFFSTPVNQIASSDAEMSFQFTIYETDQQKMGAAVLNLEKEIGSSKYSNDLIGVVSLSKNPTVQNDPSLTGESLDMLTNTYGNDRIQRMYGQIPYFNEDFTYFQDHISGVLFLLGASNDEKGILAMPHSPEFKVDEKAINYGVQYFSSLMVKRINGEGM